ncbi:MAG: HAF repeat-containing protein [Verrucomicrobia bacterium]|nr:MAG: HAF repeat-containing protein [Verrucomicrobiota bacterium]
MKTIAWLDRAIQKKLATSAIGFGMLSASAFAQYSITELGGLGGVYPSSPALVSEAYGINNSGQVVGYAFTTSGNKHAFLYSAGAMTDLGTLGGSSSQANGINNSGQVVGHAYLAGNASYHAFLYSGGGMADLGTLSGGINSDAYGVNRNGQVVGSSDQYAFQYSGGMMSYLTLGSGSWASGVNDQGQIVGVYEVSGTESAFLYNGTVATYLGHLGGGQSAATGINTNGQISGWSYLPGGSIYHAFVYSGGRMSDLGSLGGNFSAANAINDNGQLVGYSLTTAFAKHAFLYSGGVMLDLNTVTPSNSGWTLTSAQAINDKGQIVGYGTNPLGQTDAFLLTPIPEPSSGVLLVIVGIVLSFRLFGQHDNVVSFTFAQKEMLAKDEVS